MDPYSVLGVNSNASAEEIRFAYRKLAKRFHPDVNAGPEAAEMTARINAAYDILGDASKRQAYDSRFAELFDTVAEEDPTEVYRREFKRKKLEEARRKAMLKHRYQAKRYKLMRLLCFPAALFACLVIMDFFLPRTEKFDIPDSGFQKVISSRGRGGSQTTVISFMVTSYGVVRVPTAMHLNYDYFSNDRKHILLEFTPVFGTLRKVGVEGDGYFLVYSGESYVYHPLFFFLPYVIFALCVLFILKKDYSPHRYSFCAMPLVLAIGEGFLFFIDRMI